MSDSTSPSPPSSPLRVTISTGATAAPVQFVDSVLLYALLLFVVGDTGILAWMATTTKLNESVFAILSAFMTANTTGPLAAWVGFRLGSSVGSKTKDDAIANIAQRASAP